MRRFDEKKRWIGSPKPKESTIRLQRKLAAAVADMHERFPSRMRPPGSPRSDRFLDQNAAAFRDAPQLFRPVSQQSSTKARVRARSVSAASFGARQKRDWSGEATAICIWETSPLGGRPVPFDAIEFDPMIAAGDVLYDLAFLLMDLVERQLGRAANTVLNGYMARTARVEDFDGLAALPFFMSLRAAIRAKVTAARLPNVDVAAQAGYRCRAQTTSGWRSICCLRRRPGLSPSEACPVPERLRCAKLAPAIGPVPGALVLRSDVERKRLFA